MDILLIRHAHAEEREDWNDLGKSDLLRPLTKKGIIRFAKTVKGLENFIPKIDHVYTSQYTRAVQTMEIIHGHYTKSNYSIVKELNPIEKLANLHAIIKRHADDDVIAFVGHQPDLGQLCGNLLSNSQDARIRFKKGGVALISYEEGNGQLQWLLTQRQLSYLSRYEMKEES
jgi:phosphohistidine phosphatase